jgi:hypothetical protein
MKGSNTLLILAAALLFTGTATAQVTVLTHATVIDGTGADPQRDVDRDGERPHPRHGTVIENSRASTRSAPRAVIPTPGA